MHTTPGLANYMKTSLNRPTMGLTLNVSLIKVVGLESCNLVTMVLYGEIVWDPNVAIDITEWSISGSGRLERFYCISSSVTWYRRVDYPYLLRQTQMASTLF